jgi:hypothetical protein
MKKQPCSTSGSLRQKPPEIRDVTIANRPTLARTIAGPIADRRCADSHRLRQDNHSIHQSLEPQRVRLPGSDLHPVAVITLSVVAWFFAVMWLNSTGNPKEGLILAVANGIFVMFLTAILLVASLVIDDPRRKHRFATGLHLFFVSHCC